MKKFLALCLSACLLLGCFPLAASAFEATSDAEVDVLSLLTESSSVHVKNGLVYSYVSNGTVPTEFGNGDTAESENLFNIRSFETDNSLHNVEYEYSITGRFSFIETAEGAWAKVGPLSISAAKDEGLKLSFFFNESKPVTVTLPEENAGEVHSVLAIAKIKPAYAFDGGLQGCNHSFSQILVDNTQVDAEVLDAALAHTGTAKDQNFVLGGAPVNVYSVQVYNRALSSLDYVQNLFADIIYAHGLTALDPSYMTEEARTAYMMPLLSVQNEDPFALTKDEVAKRLDDGAKALDGLERVFDYSAFLLPENASEYWAETHNELLNAATEGNWNIIPYFSLNEARTEAFHDSFYDLDELTEQAVLDLIATLNENPYAELAQSVLTFKGYQARLEGNAAIRALFSVDNAAVLALEEDELIVSYGAILQDASGKVLQIAECYGENKTLDAVFTSEETDRFALTVEAEENTAEELSAVYTFSAFVSVNDGEFTYTTLISCANELFGATASIASVCNYFYENGYADAPAVALGASKSVSVSAMIAESKEKSF